MLWQKAKIPGIMQDSWPLLYGSVHKVRMWPGSYPLNANRLCFDHTDKQKCPTSHPRHTAFPVPVKKPWFTWEDCRQQRIGRHAACRMVWGGWVSNQIQLRKVSWADLTCIHSSTSLLLPSRDCFSCSALSSNPTCSVSGKPCACCLVILLLTKSHLVLTHVGLAKLQTCAWGDGKLGEASVRVGRGSNRRSWR